MSLQASGKVTPEQLTGTVKDAARELGFDASGIVLPKDLLAGEEHVLRWTAAGHHGEMKYLETISKRRESFFPDLNSLKSVIVLGVNYYQPSESGAEDALSGKIARYAWGRDYHLVIREKHDALIRVLHEKMGFSFEAYSCIDAQPVAERYLAHRAGLGFAGKHTGTLNSQFGPWLFLSEIVTSLELIPDAPSQGNCGTCTECQTECPTGALDQDYTMDARLCIAYLTIEHKGVIPSELRSKIGNWIFGCDACLVVCPFTSKKRESSWPEFQAAAGAGEALTMEKLFSIRSNSEYENVFQGSPLMRVSRKQLMRNACIVLGNSGKREAIAWLEKALQDPAPLVRLHAAWGLGQLPFPEARGVLQSAQVSERDASVIEEIFNFLK